MYTSEKGGRRRTRLTAVALRAVVAASLLVALPSRADLPLQERGPYDFRLELSSAAAEAMARNEIKRQSTFDVEVRFDCPPDSLWGGDFYVTLWALGASLSAAGAVPIDSDDSALDGAIRIPIDVAALCPTQAPALAVTVSTKAASAVGIEAQLSVRGSEAQARYDSGLFLAIDRTSESYQKRGAGAFMAEQLQEISASDAISERRQVADRIDDLDLVQFEFSHPDDQPSMRVDLATGEPR